MTDMAQPQITSHRRQVVRIAAPAFAGLLLLGACGKKDEPAATTPGQASSGSSVTTAAGGGSSGSTAKSSGSTPGTATKGSTVGKSTLNQTVWFENFKVALGAYNYDSEAETLQIEAEVENLGDGAATFYGSNLTLEDGNTQVSSGRVTEATSILAKGKAKT